MRRPEFIQQLFIQTEQFLSVKCTITLRRIENERSLPHFPLEDMPLLRRQQFTLKIVLKDENQQIFGEHLFDTDSFGQACFRIPLPKNKKIHTLQSFETSFSPGVEFLLGSHYPLTMNRPNRIVISDFDKTLVATSYSGLLDIFTSLINPVTYFPPVKEGIKIFKEYIEKDYSPFVLSASPHFYESTIKDWLCGQGFITSGLFLKDYRQSFSISDGMLGFKDLWNQGLYKLDQLLDLLIMSGLPDEIILLGDDHESDPVIYLTLAHILTCEEEPYRIWQNVIQNKMFKFSQRQKAKLLSKIYELSSFLYDRRKQQKKAPRIHIYIRRLGKPNKIPEALFNELEKKMSFSFF